MGIGISAKKGSAKYKAAMKRRATQMAKTRRRNKEARKK
jgi:hypothetical protein